MSLPTAAIRTAVAELLEGSIGTTRTVDSGTFLRGVFEGMPPAAAKALALQTSTARHRFDVRLRLVRNDASTSVAKRGSRRIVDVGVEVLVTSNLSTSAQATQRAADLATILEDCETAAAALAYPANLALTSAGEHTRIIGGALRGEAGEATPRVEQTQQNWDTQLARTVIRGHALVNVSDLVVVDGDPVVVDTVQVTAD